MIKKIKLTVSNLFVLILSFSGLNSLTNAAIPFSPQQKADIIDRINTCQLPIFKDGYETKNYKISLFEEQDGSFLYCGYHKKTKAKIILPAVKGDSSQPETIWQAKSGNVTYTIKNVGDASYSLIITKQGAIIYQAEAWSIYPP
jgi:hypothetical protein